MMYVESMSPDAASEICDFYEEKLVREDQLGSVECWKLSVEFNVESEKWKVKIFYYPAVFCRGKAYNAFGFTRLQALFSTLRNYLLALSPLEC